MKKVVCVALICLLFLSGCGAKLGDMSAYGDTPIEIVGLTEDDFTVTPNELAQLECVSRTATGATAKAGTVNAYGPLLDTFLEQHSCKAADFYKIRILCADGYKVVLKDDYLTDYEIVLAVSYQGESLPEVYQPLRLLIPEGETSKWAYSIVRIEFEREK